MPQSDSALMKLTISFYLEDIKESLYAFCATNDLYESLNHRTSAESKTFIIRRVKPKPHAASQNATEPCRGTVLVFGGSRSSPSSKTSPRAGSTDEGSHRS